MRFRRNATRCILAYCYRRCVCVCACVRMSVRKYVRLVGGPKEEGLRWISTGHEKVIHRRIRRCSSWIWPTFERSKIRIEIILVLIEHDYLANDDQYSKYYYCQCIGSHLSYYYCQCIGSHLSYYYCQCIGSHLSYYYCQCIGSHLSAFDWYISTANIS